MPAPPITNSLVGKRLVNIFARGVISLCRKYPEKLPLPKTIAEFEAGLMNYARLTKFQAGIAFLEDKQAHRDFYELLGINPDYAGRPYAELFKLAESDPTLERGLQLVFAFVTAQNPSDREVALQRSTQIFREVGGPDFEDIAVAFENGDCQYRLVFQAMQEMLQESKPANA